MALPASLSPRSRAFFTAAALVLVAALAPRTLDPNTARRLPASDDEKASLRRLYPDLSPQAFDRKLEAAKTPFLFFRSFAPLYYRLFSGKLAALPESLRRVTSQEGWCAGDAHPENFGVLVDDSGAPTFTINDADDSGPCPIAADLLRFLVATRIAAPKLADRDSLAELLDGYFDGTQGRLKFSKPVRRMLDEAEGDTRFSDSLEVTEGGKKISRRVSGAELEDVERALRHAYGEVSVAEAHAYVKSGGGSGGLLRYRVRVRQGDENRSIELKTIARPSVFFLAPDRDPVKGAPEENPARRVMRSLRLFQPSGISRFYAVEEIAGTPMLLRPRYAAIASVELGDLARDDDPDAFIKVFKDEAAVLGVLHARSTKNDGRAIDALRGIPTRDWDAAEKILRGELLEQFQKIRGSP